MGHIKTQINENSKKKKKRKKYARQLYKKQLNHIQIWRHKNTEKNLNKQETHPTGSSLLANLNKNQHKTHTKSKRK